MELYKRIKQRRKELKISQDELAKKLGYKSRSTIAKIEKGENDISQSKIAAFATALQTTPGDLMGWTSQEKQNPTTQASQTYEYIPTSISAGMLEEINAVNSTLITVPDALAGRYAGNKDLCFMRVNGESMNRVIDNHSTIAVLKNISVYDIKNGDIIVATNSHGEYTVKRFFNDPNNERFILQPDSDDFSFLPLVFSYNTTEDIKIFGKVVIYSVIL